MREVSVGVAWVVGVGGCRDVVDLLIDVFMGVGIDRAVEMAARETGQSGAGRQGLDGGNESVLYPPTCLGLLWAQLQLIPLLNLLAGLSVRVKLGQHGFATGYTQCPLQFPRGIPA